MDVERRLDQLEQTVRARKAHLAAERRPRHCVDCEGLVPPLEIQLPPYARDVPRCDGCELRRLGAVLAIMEESGAGPSWAFDRYMARHGVGPDAALVRLQSEDFTDVPVDSEEKLLGIAVALADMGLELVDRREVQRFFEMIADASFAP